MQPKPIEDTSRLCVHTMTTKPLALGEAIDTYQEKDINAITVWRQHIEPLGVKESARMLKESGMNVVSLCRGGFFPATSGMAREQARAENRQIIDEAAELGAPVVVLVCGALGNALNAALRPDAFSSIGASTATFAALAVGASFVWRRGYFSGRGWRRAFAPVFGGIALLAFTGIGGERTDVLAHFMGFGVGVIGGSLAASFDIRRLGKSGQYIAAGLTLGLLALAWSRALG